MTEEPPVPPPVPPPITAPSNDGAAPLALPQADGRVVIDLTQLVPAPPADQCGENAPDPFSAEIVVCTATGPSPRLGPVVGPVDEEVFGSAIPRARIKLSDTASAEANGINQSVGGFNANGGEVRLKIDF